jgi:hypothetical protein
MQGQQAATIDRMRPYEGYQLREYLSKNLEPSQKTNEGRCSGLGRLAGEFFASILRLQASHYNREGNKE